MRFVRAGGARQGVGYLAIATATTLLGCWAEFPDDIAARRLHGDAAQPSRANDGPARDGARDANPVRDVPVDARRHDLAPAANGTPCNKGSTCRSRVCADGVCCDKACAGICEACNNPGAAGLCTPKSAASTCGSATCATATTVRPAPTCNGKGACAPAAAVSCGMYLCDVAKSACFTSCTPQNERMRCSSATRCTSGGMCARPLLDGRPCKAGGECASGFCVNGVCCNKVCSGSCFTCNLAGAAGMCVPLPTATVCVKAVCKGATRSTNPSTCDGKGKCVAGKTVSCDKYRCDTAAGACFKTCTKPTSRTNCAPGSSCKGTRCGD